jgi:hypothetical protein
MSTPETRAFRRGQARPVDPEWRNTAPIWLAWGFFAHSSKDKEGVQKILCFRFGGTNFFKC